MTPTAANGRASRWPMRIALLLVFLSAGAFAAGAVLNDFVAVAMLHAPRAEHVRQDALVALINNNQTEAAFEEAFEHGDELFETVFNSLDGVGANVGDGQRFTRVPRADLSGPGEWAKHRPRRETGPNAESCNACHNQPGDDGAGGIGSNVHRDPLHSGVLASCIQRNTPHLFGAGAVQRLAEEMSADLQAIRAAVIAAACAGPLGNVQRRNLQAKGVDFGMIRVTRTGNTASLSPVRDRGAERRARRRGRRSSQRTAPSSTGQGCPDFPNRSFDVDTSAVAGVDSDLVVKPFQWKGSVAFIRQFNRDAAHNELGMQAVEIAGDGVDGDFDGVADEMTIGDQTALAVYISAQPRPVTTVELAMLGLTPLLDAAEIDAIADGETRFSEASCDSCHKPALVLEDALFSEPSQDPDFRDSEFPAGQNPIERGVDPALPITFDLTADLPDNRIETGGGVVLLGNHISNGTGGAIVRLYGDLKRHDLGSDLAESVDEVGTGASTFLTKNLWGVGSTAPYLHDGRATTLTEAILAHGGEAAPARDAFRELPPQAQRNLIAFLESLVLFKQGGG